MRKNTLSSVLLGLLSILAVACGDAGAGYFDEDPDPGEVLAGDPGGDEEAGANLEDEMGDEAGNDDGQDGPDEAGNEDGQEGGDEAGNEDGQEGGVENTGTEDEVPIVVVGPACGDGKLDASETCDDRNDRDGDGCSSACEIEVEGVIAIDVTIDLLLPYPPPTAEDGCSGTIDLLVGAEVITGSGRCFLDDDSNTLDYVLDLDLADRGKVTGRLDVTLYGGGHRLDVAGSVEDGVLYFEFEGATVFGGTSATWTGGQKAVLE